jgi:hypothetical protein
VDGDPNNHGVEGVKTTWPVYNSTLGGGMRINMVFTVNLTGSTYTEWDTWRGERIAFIEEECAGVLWTLIETDLSFP